MKTTCNNAHDTQHGTPHDTPPSTPHGTDNYLSKDVLSIIEKYIRPTLWLYRIVDPDRYSGDDVKWSRVIEADNYREACIKIFNEHIDEFIRHNFIKLTDNEFVSKIIENERLMNSNGCCSKCDSNMSKTHRFCYKHFPSIHIFLKYYNDDDKKYDIIHRINYNITRWSSTGSVYILRIKELIW